MNARRNIQAIYALSPMQKGMLFHSLYAPESGAYFEQFSCKLHGTFQYEPFVRAWERVVQRHDILRTSFTWDKLDKILQIVHRQVDLHFERKDWRQFTREEQEDRLSNYLITERQKGFALDKAPLMRFALLQTADEEYQFVWHHHHLLLDGWSLPNIMQEVLLFYQAFCNDSDLQLPTPPPFGDYIRWLGEQDDQAAESYWRSILGEVASPTPLVVDRAIEDVPESYATVSEELSLESTRALLNIAQSAQITLSTLVHGAWALLLHRYSGEENVMFGSTVSGRPSELADVEQMIGLFINTLPLHVEIEPDLPVLQWLRRLQERATSMNQYAYSSLLDIQGWSSVPRDLPLFESIVVFENYPLGEVLANATEALGITDIKAFEQTNYPLTVVSGPGKKLPLSITYDASMFDQDTIIRMLGHLRTILEGIAEDPEGSVDTLPLLTANEWEQLINQWSGTTVDFPANQCIQQLFEEQVQQRPEAIAVLDQEGAELTYLELDQRANQLANHLLKKEIKPDQLVAIMLDPSPEAIIAVYGVLKAGAAYVPLDPTYPEERINFTLEDSGASHLVTRSKYIEKLSGEFQAELVLFDEIGDVLSEEPSTRPDCQATANNLAYVIYTSGSTGKPKGTLLEHRGVCNLAKAFSSDFDVKSGERLLQFFSLAFDGSVIEIFPTLSAGATLVTARRDTLIDFTKLIDLLIDLQINHVILTPSVLANFPDVELPDLKTLMAATEKCGISTAERWSDGRIFANGYGPTEDTVATSWYVYDGAVPAEASSIPIGRPVANKRVYVVDEQLRPVPIGVPGELLIGGVALARGYLNRPALTRARFVPDPFRTDDPHARVYKSGDIVRYLADGNIEFLGRKDDQVKLRGFRVELGEVESSLERHSGVEQAIVVAQSRNGLQDQLVAYFVPRDGGSASPEVLNSFLKENLPRYMIPSIYMPLEELPRLPNGKIDRKALPQPNGDRPTMVEPYVAPRNPTEEIIAGVWGHVLGTDRVGIHDDFHDLGGHSLLATQIVSRLRRIFKIELPLRSLFENPTVAGLSRQILQMIDQELRHAEMPLMAVERSQGIPLSFGQQRLWFLDKLAPGNLSYSIPAAISLTGKLDVAFLHKAAVELVRRHESLRTTFVTVDDQPVQQVRPEADVALPVVDLRQLREEERADEIERLVEQETVKPFDLATGPLLRMKLLKVEENKHVFIIVVHHIIADGWSLGIVVRELAALYQAFAEGEPSPLPELSLQYADYSYWQRQWLKDSVLDEQMSYWKEQLDGAPSHIDLPVDRRRPAVKTWHGAMERFNFSPELAKNLQRLSGREGVTQFMTLLAAFQTLLFRYSAQEDISVGTAVANRNRPEIEPLVGFFVNTLVMRTDFSGRPSFKQLLHRVRETALQAYANQDLPFEMLVETLEPQRDLSYSPLFQVAFSLQNTPIESLALPGVTWKPLSIDNQTAKFDLMLEMAELPEGLRGYLEYNTDIFERPTITRMIAHLESLLQAIVDNPDLPVTDLPLLTGEEKQLMLQEWNETSVSFPDEKCIHELFEQQVRERPDAVALTYHGQSQTYGELNARANQLAHYLRDMGIGRENLVGIALPRSPEMIVSILATLKAGAAYIPLDPNYPPQRLAFMVEDAKPSALLTFSDASFLEHLGDHEPKILNLETEWTKIAQKSESNLTNQVRAEDLAYVIYTSGSTGKPKGAMLSHLGLCNLTDVQRRAFGIRAEHSRILQFSPFSFDASVWEIFMALRNGATLVLADQETLADAQSFIKLVTEERVTTVTLPPSMLSVLPSVALPDLATIITAGEPCSADLVNRWAPGRQFYNAYGPTETTVCAAMYLCHPDETTAPPIGRPISNFQLYVLDQFLQPVPLGVPGELCIGGVGLAKGYLNRPELTAERFVHLPGIGDWQAPDGRPIRLYRSGDLVRYRPDGNIEFLGRIDNQVKIRGVRIELGEIEEALKSHEGLKDAVVVPYGETVADRRLVAYVIPKDESSAAVNELRSYLRRELPESMIPSHFVQLASFPLSPSGKVERGALPTPDNLAVASEQAYVAPRSQTEEKLVQLASELLKVKRVGVLDNFFEMGGHSLLATQLMTRVQDAFNVTIPLRALFEDPTISALATQIDEQRAKANGNVDRIEVLLQELEQASDEDVARLLEELKSS